jgi:SPRY domain
MIVPGSANPLLLGQSSGYNISRSLRFKTSGSQTYLTRTPSSTGNRRTFTYSTWVKRSEYTYWRGLLGSGDIGTVGIEYLRFSNDGSGSGAPLCNLEFGTYGIGGTAFNVFTTSSFRDPSAWYHVVLAVDTTQATAANRVKIYVNNVQQTLVGTYPTQNTDTYFNSSSYAQAIGDIATTGVQAFDGYMTEVRLIDGQQLTPSSFGAYSSTTGVWQPKAYAGTYGTNGYFLNFSNNASTTTLGYDYSGNGNNYTANNFSLTAGATYDSMTDVPTLTSTTAANFATFNPLNNVAGTYSANPTFSNGNLLASASADTKQYYSYSTIQVTSNKWYAEFTPSGVTGDSSYVGISTDSYLALYAPTGNYYNNSSFAAYGATYTTNDVIGVAYDADAGTITFYKNGTSQGQKTGITGSNARFVTSSYNTGASHSWTANFGQRPFAYTPPTGYVALNTFNLPTPTIGATASTLANKYFNVNTYTGTGSTLAITNSGAMQPDFLWVKSRSNAANHALMDSLRGVSKQLQSSTTNAESTNSAGKGLQSFNSNGFTLGQESDAVGGTNDAGQTYVGWQWRASNAAGVSNTSGSITSTVSANTSAGFSIVGYTGTGSNATVGHGLGVAPKMIITKVRSTSGPDWGVYHSSLGATQYLLLDTTAAAASSINYWNNTAPTSLVFSVGISGSTNNSGNTMIAYCFAEVAGFSKFGSYTGNGSSDGTFVYTGFRPRYIMQKRTDTAGYEWELFDTARNPSNVTDLSLAANSSRAEASGGTPYDLLSNGFKARSTSGSYNANGATYIYACFAENPFKYSLAR